MKVKAFYVFAAVMVAMFEISNNMNYKIGYLGGWSDARKEIFEKESEFRLRAEKAIRNSGNTKGYKILDINPNMYGDSMNMVDARLSEPDTGRHCIATVTFGNGQFGDRARIDGCYDMSIRSSKIIRRS